MSNMLPHHNKLNILWCKLTGTSHDIPVVLSTELFSDIEEYQKFIEQDDLKLQFRDIVAL